MCSCFCSSYFVHSLAQNIMDSSGAFLVVPMLSIVQHGVHKGSPDCHHQHPSLVSKIIHTWGKNFPSVHRPRATLSALNCLFVHHLAARPESLGVIAWLLRCCCFLAACAKDMAAARPCLKLPDAKDMAAARPSLIVAVNTQTLCLTSCLRVLHIHACIYVHTCSVLSLKLITFDLV